MLLLLACAGSPEAEPQPVDKTVTLAPPEQGYQVLTEPFVVEPYTEREICSVVRVQPQGDETLAWFDRLETLSAPDSHHMNVFIGQFSFLDVFLGEGAAEEALGVPLGQYDCSDLAVMESAFPVIPSQRQSQEITFPEGVAAPMLVPAVVVFSHHVVNPTDQAWSMNAALNVHTVPRDEVEDVASLVFDAVPEIEVPPGERRVVHRTCTVDRAVDVALVSTHTHEWGECAALSEYDGSSVAEDPFFVNKDWEVPPILHFEPGSYSLEPGEGIHYACHFDNDTDRTLINDGTAEGEMCVFATVLYPAPMGVAEVEEIVESADLGGLVELMDQAMGPCPGQLETDTPWTEAETCEDYPQTEGNTL